MLTQVFNKYFKRLRGYVEKGSLFTTQQKPWFWKTLFLLSGFKMLCMFL